MPSLLRLATAAAVVLALAGCSSQGEEARGQAGSETESSATPAPSADDDGGEATGFAAIPEVVNEVAPSVVAVRSTTGEGSGVVWSEDGIIVTNAHVVGAAEQVVVAFADGQRVPAEVVAVDTVVDIAVLDAEREDLPPATFADNLPEVGELAIAVGNPLGFENTVTAGIISGLQRSIPGSGVSTQSLVDLIQTDAAISPGNSGGALLNGAGEVVGINVAYIPPQARAVSIGFAIPAPTVVDVVTQLLDDGDASHAYLGFQPGRVTPQIAQQFGLDRQDGILVLDVSQGGPVARGGVEPGDVIVGIAGNAVPTLEALLAELRALEPGQQVDLTVVRDGEEQVLQVEVGDRPELG